MPRIALVAHNGRYVQAGPDGTIQAVGRTRGPAETFELVDAGPGRVGLRAASGRYVRVRADGVLVADAVVLLGPETFRLNPLANGRIGLRSPNGTYVSVGQGDGATLVVSQTRPGAWETFRMETPGRDPRSGVAAPVLIVAPANGRQGQPVPLPIALVNPDPRQLRLDGAVEISGVPAAFEVLPGQPGREHAPGFLQWTVALADLADVQLVPRRDAGGGFPTGGFAVGVCATGRTGHGDLHTALQFLDVTVVPDAGNLRVVMDPLPAMTVIDSSGDFTLFHRPLGPDKAVVFQVSGAQDARLGLFARPGDGTPAYEVRIGGQSDSRAVITRDTERASAPAPDALNPNSAVGSTWTRVDGALSTVAANALGDVWGVLDDGSGAAVRAGGAWQPVGGAFRQVAVGLGSVWGLAWDGSVSVRTGVTPDTPGGSAWVTAPVDVLRVHQISAGLRGQLWGSGAQGQVVVRTGISDATPAGTDWQPVDSPGLVRVSCCGLSVWGVGRDDTVWFRTGVSEATPTGTGWTQVPGPLRQVAVSATGRVWALDPDGRLHVRVGVTAADLMGTGWQAVGGGPQLRQVTCTAAGGWAVDTADAVWFRRGAEAPTFWADARNGLVRLGHGAVVGEDVIVQWQDPAPVEVERVGVRTQGGPPAHWALSLPGSVPLGARIIDSTRRPGIPLQVVGTGGDQPGPAHLTIGDGAFPPGDGPGLTLAVLDRATLARRSQATYDTRNRADERARLARDLDGLGDDRIVCIWSSGGMGTDPLLADALRRCGANAGVRTLAAGGWSYALVGIPGRGESTGFEDVRTPPEGRPAEVRLLWHDGVLERDPGVPWQSSAPLQGSWRPSHVLLSGLPTGASLSAGQRLATAADGTTVWSVPAPEVEGLAVTMPAGTPSAGGASHGTAVQATFSAQISATLTLGPADIEASASATSEHLAEFGSDGLNAWASAQTTNTAGARVGAEFSGGHTIVLTAAAAATAGAGGTGGIGERTRFPCPVCDGSGKVDGPGSGTSPCPRCGGTGVLEAPGARLHLYAGALLEASVSVSVGVQITHDVTASGTLDARAKAGAQVVGDLEVYAGSGRFGGKASGETFVGAGVEASIEGRVRAYGSSVGGSGGVQSSGIAGVEGGGTAVWDDGKLTLGAKGGLAVMLFGIDADVEITVDSGPLRSVVVTGWDRYGTVAVTYLINGGPDAIRWAQGAGATLALGADGLVQLGAGGAYLGDVLQQDVGGPFTTFGVGAGDFVLDAGVTVGTAFSQAGEVIGDFLTGTGTAVTNGLDDVAHHLSDIGGTIESGIRDIFDFHI